MKKSFTYKILTTMFILFISTNVFSLTDLSINSITLLEPEPLFQIELNSIDYNILIKNNDAITDLNATLTLFIDSTDVNNFTIEVPANQTKNFTATWLNSIKQISIGIHSIEAKITNISPADNNALNNSIVENKTIYSGKNVLAQNIFVNGTIMKNQTIQINAKIKAIDYDINAFKVKLTDSNGVIIVQQFVSIQGNEEKIITGNYFTGNKAELQITLETDVDNAIIETSESDNSLTEQFIIRDKADLTIQQSKLSYSPEFPDINQNTSVSFFVDNNGVITADNFKITAYKSSIVSSNILFMQTVSLNPNSSQQFTFSFKPEETGNHLIILNADEQNLITEENETNNKLEFIITTKDINSTENKDLNTQLTSCQQESINYNNNYESCVSEKKDIQKQKEDCEDSINPTKENFTSCTTEKNNALKDMNIITTEMNSKIKQADSEIRLSYQTEIYALRNDLNYAVTKAEQAENMSELLGWGWVATMLAFTGVIAYVLIQRKFVLIKNDV